ncbi:2-oxoglutarate-Fe(II)-dependent oxygenase superfamily protein [Pseudoxanthomonas sp. 3HH-4]|uniref:2OG-Fe(II) oxygenase n=1 Tax=Pseudoxanthomonas sp. 3HH-4 TaxID=1690214 RepID=UPI001150E4ED|nr:2OG-Fe(II) oxygenase [Pseudoxanthomonas sp. 3HH-4]TQM17541.1 2-oxoglutarate-Fe(II)-dependent oxygenase superfamily protein [Pseudoxanthomonas sp. 3HH-4]
MKALADYIRIYDDALPAAFCQQLIDGFESSAQFQAPNGRGYRPALDDSRWTELNLTRLADPAFVGFFMTRIEEALARYNADLSLTLPVPLRPRIDRLTMKKYRANAGEGFQPHFDSVDEVAGRYMVFLWYLNDVQEGGSTRFMDLEVDVQPRAGRLLVFPPYWMFQHVGNAPVSNDKYILSTYLLFDKPGSPEHTHE